MTDTQLELTLQEATTTARSGTEKWTEFCIGTDDMIGLVEHGGKHPGAPALLDHMVRCNFCSQTYNDLQADLTEEQEALRKFIANRPSPS